MNAYFISWSPSDNSPCDADYFNLRMKDVLRQHDGELSSYAWTVPDGCEPKTGDVLYFLQNDSQGATLGVAMVALVVSESQKFDAPYDNAPDGVGIQPIYMFDAERYPVLQPSDIATALAIPETAVHWSRFSGYIQLDDEDNEKVANLWMDYILAHYDTITCRGSKRTRQLKSVTLFDDASILVFVPEVYPFAYRRYHHKCDICGFDYDYVFSQLNYLPTMRFIATKRESLSHKVPDYRSVSCVCSNCWPLLAHGTPLSELRQKVRTVTCDNSTFAMQVRLTPGRLLS